MVDSKQTNPALKPVQGEEHTARKELLKRYVENLKSWFTQPGGYDKLQEAVAELTEAGQYAVAIKLINYYVNTKYKLFKSLAIEFLPKKVIKKKVNQTSMAIVFNN
jgi:hypothetical protein